ncbi:hypothetical protein [Spirosoma pollinicola]|uniref:hypothetical protein n=1 Tax=Spirosoma pollinicola TaxID=2057025 RepID=UPI00147310B9|nr:hypothetical protein [Spirosoma pollinicola]
MVFTFVMLERQPGAEGSIFEHDIFLLPMKMLPSAPGWRSSMTKKYYEKQPAINSHFL